MKIRLKIILFFLLATFSSFTNTKVINSNSNDIKNLEQTVLKQNIIGKIYTYDLTKRKGCNKTKIEYLGLVQTKTGKKYKVLNSFHVFIANSTCHGTSDIKFFDMKNNYIGKYYASMPEELPNKLVENKLIWANSVDCDKRDKFTLNLENELPKSFFLPCSKNGGNEYAFSME